MSNLIIFNDAQKFTYDWELIEDTTAREVVKKEITEYQAQFETSRRAAEQIITQDTTAKAKCVYEIKQQLPHGQFRDVCQQALNVNKDQAAAYLSIHKNILLNGATSEDILDMVSRMEPRAAAKLLKADDETKSRHGRHFKQTGHVPSRRDFTKPKASNDAWRQRQEQQARMDYNIQKKMEESWSDSPASPFYKPPVEEPDQAIDVSPSLVSEEPAQATEGSTKSVVSPLWREL